MLVAKTMFGDDMFPLCLPIYRFRPRHICVVHDAVGAETEGV